MNMNMRNTRNAADDGSIPDSAWCEWCGNEGVCILEGTITVGGLTYSRGSAPCLWCDQGALRMAEWSGPSGQRKATDHSGKTHTSHHRQLQPESRYTMYDVVPTKPEPRRGERFKPDTAFLLEQEAAGCKRAALQGMFPRTIWPPAWTEPPTGSLVGSLRDDDEFERKRALAIQAKNEAERA